MKPRYFLVYFLALSLSIPAAAQMNKFMLLESFDKTFALRDSLKAFYKDVYDLASFDYNRKNDATRITFSNTEGREIKFSIRATWIGKDDVLEKEGVQTITRFHVQGRFLDLFNLYKRFIDPSAQVEKLKEKGLDRGKTYKANRNDPNEIFVNLYGSNESWELIVLPKAK